ncbi:helix-turn-helix transcriptional regulator [Cytophagaceae bacterium DM2B3-1]|uniref:Helix-turn-helix transcriptional regulator n=1 Tax=Xanthocytophaga flava TaxID=3048013 RepID=A0ABT7CXE6_9BACT|nr:helix-turn-helix transcriptional regulator [Xanthocytophaga flavus]
MTHPTTYQIKTIAEYHRLMELPAPAHPLVSVIRFEDTRRQLKHCSVRIIHNFYTIALKKNFNGKLKYGQQEFDFDAGVMHFMAPRQVLAIDASPAEFIHSGWLLLIHPDFLWNTPLAQKIKKYEYFGYQVNEALHLSDREEGMISDTMQHIAHEYQSGIDAYTQDVLLAHIELVLTYCERFYQRQFITRKLANHQLLNRLEELLTAYFKSDDLANKGMPSIQYISEQLHISPNYLSRLLKTLTGQSTKQFVHDKLMDLAKEKLSTTDQTVNEIAYALGFEHPQSFSKLFKSKTKLSPLEFRHSFH